MLKLQVGTCEDRSIRREQAALAQMFEDMSQDNGFAILTTIYQSKLCKVKGKWILSRTSSYRARMGSTYEWSVIPATDTYQIEI